MAFDRYTRRRAFLIFKREDLIQNYINEQTYESQNYSSMLFFLFKYDIERIDRMLKEMTK